MIVEWVRCNRCTPQMSADGPLTLRWHEFSSNMAGTSAAFRTREAFTDLTLVVENSKVGTCRDHAEQRITF